MAADGPLKMRVYVTKEQKQAMELLQWIKYLELKKGIKLTKAEAAIALIHKEHRTDLWRLWRKGLLEASWHQNAKDRWIPEYTLPSDTETSLLKSNSNVLEFSMPLRQRKVLEAALDMWKKNELDTIEKLVNVRKLKEEGAPSKKAVSAEAIARRTGIPKPRVKSAIQWLAARGFIVPYKNFSLLQPLSNIEQSLSERPLKGGPQLRREEDEKKEKEIIKAANHDYNRYKHEHSDYLRKDDRSYSRNFYFPEGQDMFSAEDRRAIEPDIWRMCMMQTNRDYPKGTELPVFNAEKKSIGFSDSWSPKEQSNYLEKLINTFKDEKKLFEINLMAHERIEAPSKTLERLAKEELIASQKLGVRFTPRRLRRAERLLRPRR